MPHFRVGGHVYIYIYIYIYYKEDQADFLGGP